VAENDLEHALMAGFITSKLGNFVAERQLGAVLGSSARFHLSVTDATGQTRDSYRMADVSVVLGKTWGEVVKLHPYRGARDVTVEVVSPSDDLERALGEAAMSIEHGAKLAWVISSQKLVFVYRPGQNKPELLGIDDAITGDDVLHGFELPVSACFPSA